LGHREEENIVNRLWRQLEITPKIKRSIKSIKQKFTVLNKESNKVSIGHRNSAGKDQIIERHIEKDNRIRKR
jgi:hypothetical protein